MVKENRRKRKVKKSVIVIFLIFAIILISFLGYYLFKKDFRVKGFKKEIDVNYKAKYNDNYGSVCFGSVFSCDKITPKSDGKVNTDKLGKYTVNYTFKSGDKTLKLKQTVAVVDKEKPSLKIEDEVAYVCPNNNKIQKIKMSATDNYDGNLTEKIKTELKGDNVIVSIKDSSGNKTTKNMKIKKEDKEAPVISLNSQKSVYVSVGETYTDEGASAVDNCDGEVKVEVSNQVDTSKEGVYNVTYSAKDSSGNESKEVREVKVITHEDGYRTVYLTFDDGPSEYTYSLLDTLKKYGVKVTFFVTGNGPDDAIKRAYDEGHTIALHTNSHDYDYVYSSVDNYFKDLYAVQARVERITGYKSNLIRFPGGSSNTVSSFNPGIMTTLVSEVENRGFRYFDWNVSSGDAGSAYTSDEVFNNVVSTLKEGSSVVLQHDIKGFSVEAVGRIIEYGQANGYTFKPLTEVSPGAHHGVNN